MSTEPTSTKPSANPASSGAEFLAALNKVTPAGAVLSNAGSFYAGKQISQDGSDATGNFAYGFAKAVFGEVDRDKLMNGFYNGAAFSPNNPNSQATQALKNNALDKVGVTALAAKAGIKADNPFDVSKGPRFGGAP